jgi:hypothetical protein
MPDSAVMVLPLPILTAMLGGAIAALMLRLDWGSRAGVVCFAMLFGLLSFSSLLVGLRFGYGIDQVALVQRVTPLFVGPLLYLGFLAFIVPKERFNRYVAGHLAVGIVIAGVTLVSPRPLYALDWIISGSYLFYLCALVWRWRKGPDHLIHAHLGLAQRVLNWMLRGAVLLAVILVIDTVIAFDFALNGGRNATALISYVSIPMILILLGVLFALPQMIAVPVAARGEVVFDGGAEHAALEAEVRALLESTQLYLEPDLSDARAGAGAVGCDQSDAGDECLAICEPVSHGACGGPVAGDGPECCGSAGAIGVFDALELLSRIPACLWAVASGVPAERCRQKVRARNDPRP